MPRYTGANLYVEWRDGIGNFPLSASRITFNADRTLHLIDNTAANADHATYLAGRKGFRALWRGYYSGQQPPLGETELARLAPGSAGALVWGELGNALGKPKHGYSVIVTSLRLHVPANDGEISVNLEFVGTGAPLYEGEAVW